MFQFRNDAPGREVGTSEPAQADAPQAVSGFDTVGLGRWNRRRPEKNRLPTGRAAVAFISARLHNYRSPVRRLRKLRHDTLSPSVPRCTGAHLFVVCLFRCKRF